MINNDNSSETMLEKYHDSPGIRALVQLIPSAGGSIDTLVSAKAERIRSERLRTFFDELAKGNIDITDKLLNSEDFIHKYYCTVKASVNTRRREKIRLFAQLFKSSIGHKNADEYEEYLNIIDDLSYREILILNTLEKHENQHPLEPEESILHRANKFWKEFKSDVCHELKISDLELTGMLTRLQRTGCYSEITGTYFDYQGGVGRLTALYYALKEFIELSTME